MQSLPPAGLPFEEFRVWSFKHVAKYGQPVLRQSRSKQEKLRKVKAYFKSLENEPNKGDKNRSICKTKQVRSDMQDMEYRDFSKFKAKMIRHNKKTRIETKLKSIWKLMTFLQSIECTKFFVLFHPKLHLMLKN